MELNLESLVYDAAYILIFVCCVVFAANRGAFRAVAGIAGTVAGAVLGGMFNAPVAALVTRWIKPLVYHFVGRETSVALAAEAGRYDVPAALKELVEQALSAAGSAAESARAALADRFAVFLSSRLAPLLAFVLIFVAVKLAVSLLCTILSLDIPVLSTLNEWAGALIGAVSGALILLVLTWAVWHFAPDLNLPVLSREALASSHIGGFICRLFS